MKFPEPLMQGKLVKRYKRFMADVVLESGETVTAHCANTGAMTGVKEPGSKVWLSPAKNPERKLKYTWELIHVGANLVGINTSLPNKIVSEAIGGGSIPELSGYEHLRHEVKYGKNSRIDILLTSEDKADCYVEVKNVHLMRKHGVAEFPDGVSTRAAKHQGELAEMVRNGSRAVTIYLCQRQDCSTFRIADDIDPEYQQAASIAREQGVESFCYACKLTPRSIAVSHQLTIEY